MKSIHNAVTDCLEELELEEIFAPDIEEIGQRKYRVTFQEIRNGNNKLVIEVEYFYGFNERGSVLDDDDTTEWIESRVIDRHGVSSMTAQIIDELLAISIDDSHFDSDSEEEDDISTVSQLSTRPPSPIPLA